MWQARLTNVEVDNVVIEIVSVSSDSEVFSVRSALILLLLARS